MGRRRKKPAVRDPNARDRRLMIIFPNGTIYTPPRINSVSLLTPMTNTINQPESSSNIELQEEQQKPVNIQEAQPSDFKLVLQSKLKDTTYVVTDPGKSPRPLPVPTTSSTSTSNTASSSAIASTSSQAATSSQVTTSIPASSSKPASTTVTPSVAATPSKPQAHMSKQKTHTIPEPYHSLMRPSIGFYPKGVPKSFLANQVNQDSIEPQDYVAGQPPPVSNISVTQYNAPQWNPLPERAYSPTDAHNENTREGTESPDLLQSGQKRVSAFQRLGPVTQTKKPKLTINLMCNKDQSVREVIEPEVFVPVHERKLVLESKDCTVVKYRAEWPWSRPVEITKKASLRTSKTVMMLEQEQMEEMYDDNIFVQISVRGYPGTWTKEKLLDTILNSVRGSTFIPCFIDFTPESCRFLVMRCRTALATIHRCGFSIKSEDVELTMSISITNITLKTLDFIPRLVLRKRLCLGYDSERVLSLKEFTLAEDVSHFIYFPLNRMTNQVELMKIPSTIVWEYVAVLDLSYNRLTSIDGFNLSKNCPRLKELDLSHNYLPQIAILVRINSLQLNKLKLEGNPFCTDYRDPNHYVKVVKMIFPAVHTLDDVPIIKEYLPKSIKNYCPTDAADIVDRFLEVYFPLLDSSPEDRLFMQTLYSDAAELTVTFNYNMRYAAIFRKFHNLFHKCRIFEEGEMDCVTGANGIAKHFSKWPPMQHDSHTFTVDVMFHNEATTVFRVNGILKLTVESLAEDEYLIAFTRTVVLRSVNNGAEYKIENELVYWDVPYEQYANTAFKYTNTVKSKISLKLESPPDDDLKNELIKLFMQVTEVDEICSAKCLERGNWNFKSALEYFVPILKLNGANILQRSC